MTSLQVFECFINNNILEYLWEEILKYSASVKKGTSCSLQIYELKNSSAHQYDQNSIMYHQMIILDNWRIYSLSRNRSTKTKLMLHFVNINKPNNGWSFKVHSLIEMTNKTFYQFGVFISYLSTDEMIINSIMVSIIFGHGNCVNLYSSNIS